MNKKVALIKSLLKGDVINVTNSIKLTGYSNPAREMTRQIEKPFSCVINREKKESKDQFGNYVTWHDFRLIPNNQNRDAIVKMKDYIKENQN